MVCIGTRLTLADPDKGGSDDCASYCERQHGGGARFLKDVFQTIKVLGDDGLRLAPCPAQGS